jgi:hypothetical protein
VSGDAALPEQTFVPGPDWFLSPVGWRVKNMIHFETLLRELSFASCGLPSGDQRHWKCRETPRDYVEIVIPSQTGEQRPLVYASSCHHDNLVAP